MGCFYHRSQLVQDFATIHRISEISPDVFKHFLKISCHWCMVYALGRMLLPYCHAHVGSSENWREHPKAQWIDYPFLSEVAMDGYSPFLDTSMLTHSSCFAAHTFWPQTILFVVFFMYKPLCWWINSGPTNGSLLRYICTCLIESRHIPGFTESRVSYPVCLSVSNLAIELDALRVPLL